nr:acyl-CoA dehydrogenase family protein [Sphingomonas sp. Y57]
MADRTYLSWPFFENRHRAYAGDLDAWCREHAEELHGHGADVDADCRRLVELLGRAGFLRAAVPADHGGLNSPLDVRTLCLTRQILAYHSGLADFVFAMQGLGTGAIGLFGLEAVQKAYLPQVATGAMIAGFALSEKEAGSDVAAMTMSAARTEGGWTLNGEKTWISNGPIADLLTVFARSGEAPGARGHFRLRPSHGDAGLLGRRAHRRDRAPPAGDDPLRQLLRARRSSARRAGAGVQGGDGDARHAARDRRGARSRHHPHPLWRPAVRSPAHAGGARRHGARQ